ncbi:C39 family peptidase [Paenibacillus sp. sgz5001063]|uniref:C39 family peptidase n=1 Tax=Paenibacillus sp. sgz5001063 TaxID=3242474 RepID=UPI0036D38494
MSAERSEHRLEVEPYTQWEPGVASPGSACGPAAMAALIEYWHTRRGYGNIPGSDHFESKAAHINYIYSHHGGTPWGMSARSFSKGLQAYIGAALPHAKNRDQRGLVSVFNDMQRYRAEIDAGRPVAVKFDKWFSLRWRGRYAYDYHWVLGTGYDVTEAATGPVLIVQDNSIRHIPYYPNRGILTMVALNIE